MKPFHFGLGHFLAAAVLVGLALFVAWFSQISPPLVASSVSVLSTPTPAGTSLSPLPVPDVPPYFAHPDRRSGADPFDGTAGVLNGDRHELGIVSLEGDQLYATLLDLKTGAENKLATAGMVNVRLSGHWLAGEEYMSPISRDYPRRIKVVDVDTQQEILLGDKSTAPQSPSVSGNIVVWQDWRNREKSDVDIYGYDLVAGREFPVVVAPGPDSDPRIAGQWVVYVKPTKQGKYLAELRAHSLKTGEDFALGISPSPDDGTHGTYYAIDADKVAWICVTDSTGLEEITEPHLYDLSTRTDRKLADAVLHVVPRDVSLSAESGIVVYSHSTQHWVIVDWLPAKPVAMSITAPLKISSGYLLAWDDYLVWTFPREQVEPGIQVVVEPVTR